MKAIILISTFLFASLFSVSQNVRTISGYVTDESGKSIGGVTVLVEGTMRGTSTDMNGFYKLTIQEADKILVFSFIGMETQKVRIGKKTKIDVVMKAEQMQLDEVVVVNAVQKEMSYNSMPGIHVTGGVMPKRGFRQQTNWNTENYATIHENGYKDVNVNPLSTFSVDVDYASYTNVRRFLNQGIKPPVDAVRIEEMVNYFNYTYPEPEGGQPFSVTAELGECPWNNEHYLLHVGLKGKSMDKTELPPSNLVFLLDVSGSMNAPNKLPLVKRAFRLLVNELRPNDRVAMVVYAGAAGKVLGSTPGNNKQKILDAIENLQAGGSTAGGEGLKLAYKIATENFIVDGNNRIILATDGDFNIGVSSTSEMERLVEKEREKGIFMTVLGFGTGNLKDDKMETIADKGNGNYAYIDNILEARKTLINEFGGTLFTIAKDVKFQLEFNPEKVASYRLIGYENRLLNEEDFNDDTKDAGEIGAGHTVTALYEIVPAGENTEDSKVDPLKYQSRKTKNNQQDWLTIKLRYKSPKGGKSKLLEQALTGNPENLSDTSDNFRFSAAVASFGMLLRNSEFKGSASAAQIAKMARNSKGDDALGYRSEFIRLVEISEDMDLLVHDGKTE